MAGIGPDNAGLSRGGRRARASLSAVAPPVAYLVELIRSRPDLLLPSTCNAAKPSTKRPKMKISATSVLALLVPAISARFVEKADANNVQLHPEIEEAEKYLIELSPGERLWVTEDEKWELRRVSPAHLHDQPHS